MAECAKITILSQQYRGKVFELTRDSYTVGRIEERDICIADPTVSTYHGSFVKSGNTYILKDNNSTNGTRINNIQIMEQELKNSDIIQLGDVEMLYDCPDKQSSNSTRSVTKISLDVNPTTSSSFRKTDLPFVTKKKKDNKNGQIVFFGIIGALALVVIILLVILAGHISKH